MSDTEASLFAALRETVSGLAGRTPLPDYDETILLASGRLGSGSEWESFAANFEAASGRPMETTADLATFLKEGGHLRGYCDPLLREKVGSVLQTAGLEVSYEYDRERYDDFAFGITRASGVVAETGTVVLNDHETSDRLAALTPWVHVAVLSEEAPVHRTLSDAIRAFGDCPNVIWVTGPSKTADVEGILIEGVHGPGEQICLRL
ncbi:MAG: LUD domain-containing protein [Verrucomicrobiae bacterium]|nr:LUD domain-containing protein [Verrucomicrobiae bacterium]